jgi:hypothetical protein
MNAPALAGALKGAEGRPPAGLLDEGDRPEVVDTTVREGGIRDLVRSVQHVRARIPVEDEVALAICLKGYKGQPGPGIPVEQHEARVDSRAGERPLQEVPERVLPHLPQERGFHSEASQADGHVGRCPAGRFPEAGTFDQGNAGGIGDEVGERLSEAERGRHGCWVLGVSGSIC